MADVLAHRLAQRPVRTAAGTSTIVVSIFYLLAQMVGAGALVALLLGASGEGARRWIIVLVGLVMVLYVTIGGMKGTTWVQIVKAVLLIAGTLLITILVLNKFDWNLSTCSAPPPTRAARAGRSSNPGSSTARTAPPSSTSSRWAWRSSSARPDCPHILIRFYTVPTAKAARKSVNWAIGIIGAFYLMTIALGFGAAALVGSKAIIASNESGNTAAPLLAEEVGGGAGSTGGAVLLAVISAVAFATILAVVAGLTLASSVSFAHDLWANVIRKGATGEKEEVLTAKIAAVVIGGISIVLGIFAHRLNAAALVALAFAVAASANLPTILYSLFWKRFTTRGALWSIYGGLVSSVTLVIFSPVVSGNPKALFPRTSFDWFR
ncbi:hypothetical protein GCM10020221_28250 [Streptomyces thioluteus]|uniref:Cation acetate symporter n=2 Tax=Streptomyces thioluteus TaxID=66431 RepID=A0ABN3WZJ9_STRTU